MNNVRLPMLNKAMILGSLIDDPTLNTSGAGIPVANFKIAAKRQFRHKGDKKEEVCFIGITAWSKLAENCYKNLRKRDFVYIEGELQSRSWITRNGDKVSTVGLLAKKIQFLSKKTLSEELSEFPEGPEVVSQETIHPAQDENEENKLTDQSIDSIVVELDEMDDSEDIDD